MDKTIIGAGSALIALGAGFVVAGELDYNLHSAFGTGGFLWLTLGAITLGLGLKASRKLNRKKPMRIGAI